MRSLRLARLAGAGLVAAVLLTSPGAGWASPLLYFVHTDHLNTPRLVADQNQTTVWRWEQLEPFGDNPPQEDPDGNGVIFHMPLRFPGQYFDKETGLAYNMARDYASDTGRYIQSDPIGLRGGINTYAYVDSNSLSWIDPSGLQIAPPAQGGMGFGGLGGFGGAGMFGGRTKPNDPYQGLGQYMQPGSTPNNLLSESDAPSPDEIIAGAPVPPFSIPGPDGKRIPLDPSKCTPGRTLTAPSTGWPGGISIEREYTCECGLFTWHIVYFKGKVVHSHFRPGPAKGTGGD